MIGQYGVSEGSEGMCGFCCFIRHRLRCFHGRVFNTNRRNVLISRGISELTLMKSRTLQPGCHMEGCQHVSLTGGAPGAWNAKCRHVGCFPAHGPSCGYTNANTENEPCRRPSNSLGRFNTTALWQMMKARIWERTNYCKIFQKKKMAWKTKCII